MRMTNETTGASTKLAASEPVRLTSSFSTPLATTMSTDADSTPPNPAMLSSPPSTKPNLSFITFKGAARSQRPKADSIKSNESNESGLSSSGSLHKPPMADQVGASSVKQVPPQAAPTGGRLLVGTRVVSPPRLTTPPNRCISSPEFDGTPLVTSSQRLESMLPLKDELTQKASYAACCGQDDEKPPGERSPPVPPAGVKITSVDPSSSPKPPFMCAGILASITSSCFFSINTLCVKLLPGGDEYGFQEKNKGAFFRGVGLMFFCGITILCQKSTLKVPRDEIWVNMMRAVCGTVGTLGAYCALNYIGMGDSSALIFSAPIWTSFLSYFILGEPLRWMNFVALPACILGIVLIAHPGLILNVDHLAIKITSPVNPMAGYLAPAAALTASNQTLFNQTLLAGESPSEFNLDDKSLDLPLVPAGSEDFPPVEIEQRLKGIVIAVSTSFIVAICYIVLKFRKSTPIQTTTFWLGACMAATSGLIMILAGAGNTPYTWREYCLLLGNGISSWIAQSLLQWAFLYEEAGVLSIVRTLDIALCFCLSALFLEDEIYWTSILGANIIGFVVVAFMLNNWFANRRASSSHMKPTRTLDVIPVSTLSGKQLEAAAGLSNIEKSSSLSSSTTSASLKSHRSNVYRIDKIA